MKLAVDRAVGLAATLNGVRDRSLAAIMMAALDVVAHRPRGGTDGAVARFASEMSERSGAEVAAGVLLTISAVAGGQSVSTPMGMIAAGGLRRPLKKHFRLVIFTSYGTWCGGKH